MRGRGLRPVSMQDHSSAAHSSDGLVLGFNRARIWALSQQKRGVLTSIAKTVEPKQRGSLPFGSEPQAFDSCCQHVRSAEEQNSICSATAQWAAGPSLVVQAAHSFGPWARVALQSFDSASQQA
jgi:hypothetical protein